MTRRLNRQGFTLPELMIAVLITSIIVLVSVETFSRLIKYFHVASVRQQLQNDANTSMNTILAALQKANASSIMICSCGSSFCELQTTNGCIATVPTGVPPNSRIEFTTVDLSTTTAIYWSNGSIYMQPKVYSNGVPQLLASNVTGLGFTGDGTDFSRVYVTMRLDAPSAPNQIATVLLSNQVAVLIH